MGCVILRSILSGANRLALVLLIGAGLMINSFVRVQKNNWGRLDMC